jgi:hypothetical protein
MKTDIVAILRLGLIYQQQADSQREQGFAHTPVKLDLYRRAKKK